MMRYFKYVFFFVIFFNLPVLAEEAKIPVQTIREEGASPRALAMGDAVRSVSFGTSGLYFNPAGMSQIYQYALETGYSYSDWMNGHTFHVSVIDSKTNKNMAAGVGYAHTWTEFPETSENPRISRSGYILRGAISGGAQYDNVRLLVGAGLKYLDLARSDEFSIKRANLDAGAIVCIMEQFFIGAVGYNLFNIDNPEFPKEFGFGAALKFMTLIISFDTLIDFKTTDKTKANYMFGAEYVSFQMLALRAGLKLDKITQRDIISFGIGYLSELFGLDLSYMQDSNDRSYSLIGAAARFFLP